MAKKSISQPRFAVRISAALLLFLAVPLLCTASYAKRNREASTASESIESLRDAEILLRGWILEVDAKAGQFTMIVNEFALPNGRSAILEPAKHKIVVLADLSPEAQAAFVSSKDLLRRKVTIVGPDTGNGPAIEARKLLIGDAIAKEVQAPDLSLDPPLDFFPSPELDGTSRPSVLARPAPLPDALPSDYFNGVKEWVAASGLRVGAKFGITDIGGRASRGNSTSDHPRGLALDFMVNRDAKRGDIVADYFVRNAQAENVKYVIWKNKIWQGGPPMDWASLPVDYVGDYTLRHMDHVHVSYLDSPYNPGPWLTQDPVLASRGGTPPAPKSSSTKSRRSKSIKTRTVHN